MSTDKLNITESLQNFVLSIVIGYINDFQLTLTEQFLNKNKPFLTVQEAAKYLQLSVPTIYTYINKGLISYYKPSGGKIYFSLSQLNDFVLNEANHYKSKKQIESEVETDMALKKFSTKTARRMEGKK